MKTCALPAPLEQDDRASSEGAVPEQLLFVECK